MQVLAVGMITQQIDKVVMESEGESSAIYPQDRIPSYLYNGANLSGLTVQFSFSTGVDVSCRATEHNLGNPSPSSRASRPGGPSTRGLLQLDAVSCRSRRLSSCPGPAVQLKQGHA